jgi:hypothetical protein
MNEDQMLRWVVRHRLRTLRSCMRIITAKAAFRRFALRYLERSCRS